MSQVHYYPLCSWAWHSFYRVGTYIRVRVRMLYSKKGEFFYAKKKYGSSSLIVTASACSDESILIHSFFPEHKWATCKSKCGQLFCKFFLHNSLKCVLIAVEKCITVFFLLILEYDHNQKKDIKTWSRKVFQYYREQFSCKLSYITSCVLVL